MRLDIFLESVRDNCHGIEARVQPADRIGPDSRRANMRHHAGRFIGNGYVGADDHRARRVGDGTRHAADCLCGEVDCPANRQAGYPDDREYRFMPWMMQGTQDLTARLAVIQIWYAIPENELFPLQLRGICC